MPGKRLSVSGGHKLDPGGEKDFQLVRDIGLKEPAFW